MLIYLDMCSIQRPHDDDTQLRVRLEAEAVLGILSHCKSGRADLVCSDVLEFEAGQNPHPIRQKHAFGILKAAVRAVRLTQDIEQRARVLNDAGLKPLDALHLACAEEAGANFFCTCDDRFLRRARSASLRSTRVVSPLELIGELGL